jgi:hypothetical protein
MGRPGKPDKTRKVKKGNAPMPPMPPMLSIQQCHPRVKSSKNGCLPVDVLKGVAIKKGIGVNENVMANLAKHLGVVPENQNTLLKSLPLPEEEKKQLARLYLRPEMPASWKDDPDMWLDSNNIRDVMIQYEDVYPTFKFLGPYPIDFGAADPYGDDANKCLITEMCELDLDGKDMKGKDCIGIVYNLDPHNKGGSHWIASFINVNKKEFYYFDSYGIKPPKQIDKFMQWLTIQEPKLKLFVNAKRLQKEDSECGMFCMYFIICMLEGVSFQQFCRNAPSDTFMLKMRKWFYST